MSDKPASAGTEAFEEILRRIKAGDRDAKQEFVAKWVHSYYHAIRLKMDRKIRSEFDSDDFFQIGCEHIDQCNFEDKDFNSEKAFFAYLERIFINAVGQAQRKQRRRGDTKSLESLSQKETERLVDAAPALLAVQAAEEEWQKALAALKTPTQRTIAQLLRQGLTARQVSVQLDVTERTARRTVDLLD